MAVLDFLWDNDEIALVRDDRRDDEMIDFLTDKETLRERLVTEPASWRRSLIIQNIAEAAKCLESSRHLNREVFLISDLQETGFGDPDTSFSHAWTGKLYVLPVVRQIENVAVVGGGMENRIFQPGVPVRVYGVIKNFGDKKVDRLLVRLFLQGRAVAQKQVDVLPGEERRVSFSTTLEERGWIWGEIRIEEDALPADDTYTFSRWIPERIRVMLLGKVSADVFPLKIALTAGMTPDANFEITEKMFGQDWVAELTATDVVVLSNYPSLTERETAYLRRYMEEGGSVFIWLGSHVDLRNYNQSLFRDTGIVLGNIIGIGNEGSGHFSFGDFDVQHPLFQDVFEDEDFRVRSPNIRRMVELPDASVERIISLSDGRPLLVEKKLKRGRILLALTGIQQTWSDIAYSTIFAPLVIRSVFYGTNPLVESADTKRVGEALELTIGSARANALYRAEMPDGEERLLLPRVVGDETRLGFPKMEMPGIYRFFQDETLIGMEAVNVDPRESDLHPISESGLRQRFPKARAVFISDAREIDSVVRGARLGKELWREMLVLGLLMLIVEMIIAREGKGE